MAEKANEKLLARASLGLGLVALAMLAYGIWFTMKHDAPPERPPAPPPVVARAPQPMAAPSAKVAQPVIKAEKSTPMRVVAVPALPQERAAVKATPPARRFAAGNADIHAVAVYEGRLPDGAPRGFQQHPEGSVDVVVASTGRPVVLYLSAYEPVEWRVRVDGARIERIVAGGYYEQRVTLEGAQGVEIVSERLPRLPYEGRGNKALEVAEAVTALFGKPPASFQGEYRASRAFRIDASSPKLELPAPKSLDSLGPGDVVLKSRWQSVAGLSVRYGGAGAFTDAWASRSYTAGKVYFEAVLSVGGTGVAQAHANLGVAEIDAKGAINHEYSSTTPVIRHGRQSAFKNGDVFGVAVDYDQGVMYARVNGQWLGGAPGTGGGAMFHTGRERAPYFYANHDASWTVNFGATPFRDALPAGYASYDGKQR